MKYGVQPGYANKAYVAGELPKGQAGRDKPEVRPVTHSPELVQAAKALGIHPGTLAKRLKVAKRLEASIPRLMAKFNQE